MPARFAGRSHLSTWLYGIALNLLRNHLARSHARACSTLDETEETIRSMRRPVASLHAALETRVELHRVLDAIALAPHARNRIRCGLGRGTSAASRYVRTQRLARCGLARHRSS